MSFADRTRGLLVKLRDRADRSIDPASLAIFRMAFGATLALSSARFLALGWVERCFVAPSFFFKFYGFEWVEPLGATGMEAIFVALSALGAMIALGLFYRVALVLFFFLFTYVELIDVTNYLNHYYLVSLLTALMVFVPANAAFSLDAKLGLVRANQPIAARGLYLLRFQVGLVYVFAAIAKLESDWLLHGQPLQIWMHSHVETPIVGELFHYSGITIAMSWAGFLNDLLAVPLLSFRRTRPFGFAMILCFHAVTGYFFNIGIFPVLMPICATLFFEPDWPRRFLPGSLAPTLAPVRKAIPLLSALAIVHCVVQVAMPLRRFAYGGDVLWHEQGMRYSWRVMLRRKSGSVTYRVFLPESGRTVYIDSSRYLTNLQEQEFSSQPDMVLSLAHHIAKELREAGEGDVEVRVDSFASLNGRVPRRMIDPEIDLTRVEDGISRASYILPGPTEPPPNLDGPSRTRFGILTMVAPPARPGLHRDASRGVE